MVETGRNFWRSSGPTPCSSRVTYSQLPCTMSRKNKMKKYPQNITGYSFFFLSSKCCLIFFFTHLIKHRFLNLLAQDKICMKLEANVLICISNKQERFVVLFSILHIVEVFNIYADFIWFLSDLSLFHICILM